MNPWEKYASESVPADGPWTKYAGREPKDLMREHVQSLVYKMAVAGAQPAESLPQYAGRFIQESALPTVGALAGSKVGGIPGGAAGAMLGETVSQHLGLTPAGSVIPELNTPDLARIGMTGATQVAAPLAFAGGKKVYDAGKALLEPFYKAGRDAIVGRALNTAAAGGQGNVAQVLARARELVPGSLPNVGEASGNAGLSSLEKAARAITPEVKNAFQLREAAQNSARLKALGDIAGTDDMMAQAIKDRAKMAMPFLQKVTESTAEVNPARTVSLIDRIVAKSPGRTQLTGALENVKKTLYEPFPLEQRGKEAWDAANAALKAKPWGVNDTDVLSSARTVLHRVKTGTLDADAALAQLKDLKGATPEAKNLLSTFKSLVEAPDQRLRANASELYQGARKNITDLLAAKAGDGSKVNEAISRELAIVMKSLDHQINKAEPAYGQYMQQWARGSEPLNQMEVGRAIREKSVSDLTDMIRPESYAKALSDKVAQQATGFKRATLEGTMRPDQMATLKAIKDDLARAVAAQHSAGTRGSDTIQNLAYSNLLDRSGMPTFLRNFAPTQVAGNLLLRGADTVYGRANKEIADQLARTMLDPKQAAQLMQRSVPSRYDAMIQELLKRGMPVTGAVASQLYQENKQ